MTKSRLGRKIIIFFIITMVINAIFLVGWFFLRSAPVLEKLDEFKQMIYQELNKEYSTIDELKINLEAVLDDKNIAFSIEDSRQNVIMKQEEGMVFFSGFTEIDGKTYFVNFISPNKINTSKLIREGLLFQFIVVSILYIITYILGRHMIIKPTENIIADIKNYNFGKKPERKEITNEFGLIQNEFVNLTEQLDVEKKEQNRIIASISHDIKTPLTSIIGYADLINEEEDVRIIKKYNDVITKKALHLKDVLSTFDDYLASYDKTPLKLSKVLIKDIVDELNNDYLIELENNNIKFEVITKLGDEQIEIDVLKFKRIFSNLISNSTRFISANGKISIRILKDENNYKFLVTDNGKGIDEEIIDKVFDPFYTTDKSRKISGLGLSICKEFVEMHGGTIKAYNNKGLTVEFIIPMNQMANE